MFNPTTLWAEPVVNPVNRKARSIPALNPVNIYGRVFTFSWFGFMVAFWSWYAFPPLLGLTIAKDIGLTQIDIANSNIIALVATLLVRLVAGPSCDRFGPRYTFAGCLLLGSIPTVLAGAVSSPSGLLALRFFVGILGGSFVPCQVWSTGFFDKNIVGTANSLTGGFGNAGGGITYFLMPAIFDSLVQNQHLTPHVAWRVAFVVPFIVITVTATAMLILCPDTPTGKWADRHLQAERNLAEHGITGAIVDVPGNLMDSAKNHSPSSGSAHGSTEKVGYNATGKDTANHDHEAQIGEQQMLDTARGEIVAKPSFKEALPVVISAQTLVTAGAYFCSFGAELAINSILGAYYVKNFPSLKQTGSGQWAAMFGLLNVVFRPLGGIISDLIYRNSNVWGKKILIHVLAVLTGAFLIAIGLTDSHSHSTMFGLVAGMAFFLEAGNGANFSLVPHVHPHANGIVSGCTGAAGNLGGIIFAIIFRYNGKDYGKVFWIIGVITIAINLALSWIKPIPKGQIGGR
ncbi:MAG: hypothetical protein HETSPECPRED_007200 [Heterodermia speciosa]|uniref:Nitrate/nitrite transporter n=1 Tax=Heterodermia speciosa TaxID=116794 RepID=A0A8H3ELX9_9LECA|nr:MAG: hypothetical protein HETSPECPRED_007200 [Heterodermia speciosa]